LLPRSNLKHCEPHQRISPDVITGDIKPPAPLSDSIDCSHLPTPDDRHLKLLREDTVVRKLLRVVPGFGREQENRWRTGAQDAVRCASVAIADT